MRTLLLLCRAALVAAGWVGSSLALAADFPAPKEADWTASDFRFHTGEVMPALRIHYTTVGTPSGEPVLVLHGTTGSGTGMLNPAFAGELFGPGQPLDATKYFIILPDAHRAGKSAKPSDGLRAKFPRYNYDDMVLAQYRLVTEGLGITPPPARDRQFDGRHAHLALGRQVSGLHGCPGAHGVPADRDGGPQLDDAADADRRRSQGSRLEGRRLHHAAARGAGRQRLLRRRDDRRLAGLLQGRADAGEGRQAARRSPGCAVHGRRERLPLPVGVLGRLQPRRPGWTGSAPRCSRSTRPTTNAIRRSLESWSASWRGSKARGSISFPAAKRRGVTEPPGWRASTRRSWPSSWHPFQSADGRSRSDSQSSSHGGKSCPAGKLRRVPRPRQVARKS